MTDRCAVGVFVGTRADLGPLAPVISALAHQSTMDVVLITGVAFTADELRESLEPRDREHVEVIALTSPVTTHTSAAMLEHGAKLGPAIGEVVRTRNLASCVVLGDRWELLYVVPALFLARVPIVHLHGGEVTEGALDERVRHAVTKLADQHCVATEESARRVRQMGESDSRIHVTGAPGLDRYREVTPASRAELETLISAQVRRPVILFTYHPPTMGGDAELRANCADALRACLSFGGSVIATHPGMDPGRDEVLAVLDEVELDEPRLTVVPSLGRSYPGVLFACDAVVGNSSSGIIEAASASVPAVDVGVRQQGRERGANVIHSEEGFHAVREALAHALTSAARLEPNSVTNPYGDGHAADRVASVVVHSIGKDQLKSFVDHRGSA